MEFYRREINLDDPSERRHLYPEFETAVREGDWGAWARDMIDEDFIIIGSPPLLKGYDDFTTYMLAEPDIDLGTIEREIEPIDSLVINVFNAEFAAWHIAETLRTKVERLPKKPEIEINIVGLVESGKTSFLR